VPEWQDEIRQRLAGLKLEATREAEIVEELSQHLGDRCTELRSSGATEEETRHAALEELSHSDLLVQELKRIERSVTLEPITFGSSKGSIMGDLWQDIRYALRMLQKDPWFTAVAVLTLALGIGANTALFSLTDQVLLRLLPVERPEELVVLRSPGPNPGHTWSDGDDAAMFSYPLYKDLREHNQVFAGLLACFPLSLNVAGQGQTERADGELVSANYFEVLGVRPALGRVFTPEDEAAPGANPVAVMSRGYWTLRFGNDPGVLNKPLIMNGTPLTVVGVARAGFTGAQVGRVPDLFIPITMKAQMTPNWNGLEDPKDHWLALLGRLKPDFTRAQAEAGLQSDYRPILQSELPLMKISAAGEKRFLEKRLLIDPGARGARFFSGMHRSPCCI